VRRALSHLQNPRYECHCDITTTLHVSITTQNQFAMTTREILLRFTPLHDKDNTEWTHKHSMPASLITSFQMQNSLEYQQLFRESITSIIPQYQAECDAKAGKVCVGCRGSAHTASLTPCSYLHIPEEPFINVFVQPICGTPQCRTTAAKMMEMTMNDLNGMKNCDVCGKIEDVKRCSRCKIVGYCGAECQKKGWKSHKKVCSQLAATREAGGGV
jgi:hypothetical protein